MNTEFGIQTPVALDSADGPDPDLAAAASVLQQYKDARECRREVQEPTATPDREGIRYEHPAFGNIQVTRTSGQQSLHGSDFTHRYYMTLRISPADVTRNLCNDWHHPGPIPYIEVNLSEAQWATMVSSIGLGAGVPCTVASLGRMLVPNLPVPKARTAQFKDEVIGRLQRAEDRVEELVRSLADAKITAKDRDRITSSLRQVRQDIGVNLQYVADQFDQHMERTTERAKVEINAYAARTLGMTSPLVIGGPADSGGGVQALEASPAQESEA